MGGGVGGVGGVGDAPGAATARACVMRRAGEVLEGGLVALATTCPAALHRSLAVLLWRLRAVLFPQAFNRGLVEMFQTPNFLTGLHAANPAMGEEELRLFVHAAMRGGMGGGGGGGGGGGDPSGSLSKTEFEVLFVDWAKAMRGELTPGAFASTCQAMMGGVGDSGAGNAYVID